jgi:hypothetical protein
LQKDIEKDLNKIETSLSPCIQIHSFIIEENILGGKQVEVEENILTKEGKIYWRKQGKRERNLFGNNLWNLIKRENDDQWSGGTLDY